MDVVEHSEMGEKEFDAVIEHRTRREPDSDELEPSYAESLRVYHVRRRRHNRALWRACFADLADRPVFGLRDMIGGPKLARGEDIGL